MNIRKGGKDPMKKFTKMLALGMAAVMTFGMTVSAAGSKDTLDEVVEGVNIVIEVAGVQDSEGKVVEGVNVEATKLPETVYNETFGKNYDEVLSKVDENNAINAELDRVFATLGNGTKREVARDVIDIVVEGEIPEGGLYVPVLPAADGEGYVVAHWNGTAWEVLKTKIENGVVYALFPQGFSPVYLSILTVSGEENPPAPTPETQKPADPAPSTPTSPKTGETLPVAGILAVICLAGVAVCAKKTRYNR